MSGRPPAKPRRRTRTEQRDHNRTLLLDAAAEVIGRRGLHASTVDDIAATAGLTKGAVYSHFDSKHELFAATIERRYRERVDALSRVFAREGDPAANASVAAAEFVASVTREADWSLLFLETWAEMIRNPAFADRMRGAVDRMRDAVQRILEPQLALLDPTATPAAAQLAEMVLAMADGFGIHHRLDPGKATAPLFATMMSTFTVGVVAQAQAAVTTNSAEGRPGP